MIVAGIDPGTTTGLALWDTTKRALVEVRSASLHELFWQFERWALGEDIMPALVLVEDARLRVRFGKVDAEQAKYGAAVREGAGAAKRDATIWDDYLADLGIPYLMRAPHRTKLPADPFRRLTGWQGQTNEHSRDAAMVVYDLHQNMVQVMIETWRQVRAQAAAPKPRKARIPRASPATFDDRWRKP